MYVLENLFYNQLELFIVLYRHFFDAADQVRQDILVPVISAVHFADSIRYVFIARLAEVV